MWEEMGRRWVPVLIAGFLFGAWLSHSDHQPAPRVEQVRVITDAQIARLEAVADAMTATTATVPATQRQAAQEARDIIGDVQAGGVEVIPDPTTTTTTASTTTVPPTTTTTERTVLTWPPNLLTIPTSSTVPP